MGCLKLSFPSRRYPTVTLFLAVLSLSILASAAIAQRVSETQRIELLFRGSQQLPGSARVFGTTMGGLSGIDYDPETDTYLAVSDDNGRFGPPRYYSISLKLSEFLPQSVPGRGAIVFNAVTYLSDEGCELYSEAESIRIRRQAKGARSILWVSEAIQPGACSPLRESSMDGRRLATRHVASFPRVEGELPLFRPNKGLESLALSSDGNTAYVANEYSLANEPEDGPVRIVEVDFNAQSAEKPSWYTYMPDHDGGLFGVVELLLVRDGRLFVIERHYAKGLTRVRLYMVDLERNKIRSDTPLRKTLILDLGTLKNYDGSKLKIDNVEGMTFGPRWENGASSLILLSDSNFNSEQATQFLVFEVRGLP